MANELRVRNRTLSPEAKAKKAARAAVRYVENRDAMRAQGKAYYEANRDQVLARQAQYGREKATEIRRYQRAYRLRKTYGMTVADYDRMFAAQGGVCAICHQPEPVVASLPVDHDHNTGRVRALLCTPCNTALGLTGEEPARLRALADYLETHRE